MKRAERKSTTCRE